MKIYSYPSCLFFVSNKIGFCRSIITNTVESHVNNYTSSKSKKTKEWILISSYFILKY